MGNGGVSGWLSKAEEAGFDSSLEPESHKRYILFFNEK